MAVHPLHLVLLADIGEWMGLIVGAVAFIGWLIRQITEANKQAPPARGRQQPIAPARPQPAADGAKAGQQADPLRSQVEEFLRRAGHGPQEDQRDPSPQQQAGPTSEVELVEARRATAESRPTGRDGLGSGMPQPTARPQPIQKGTKSRRARSAPPAKRETLAQRAEQREGERARRLAEQASQLGRRIAVEDQLFDAQVHAKFDHSVGTLAGSAPAVAESAAAPQPSTPAAQIAAILANPEGVRQAVIMNEILRRPSDRW